MRLVYFSNSRIPTEKGYGIQIMKMCRSFAEILPAVDLIIPTKKNEPFRNINPFDYYQANRNFKIKKIECYDPAWIAKRLPQGFYIKIQALFFMISLFFYLLLKKNKAAYVFYTRDEYLLPLLQLFSKRVVWEAHTLPRTVKYYLQYWRKCFRLIAITQGLKNELMSFGLPSERILVAPDGVDLSEFNNVQSSKKELREQLGLPMNKNIIMYTGHLYDWKGVQGLADAAKFLTDQELVVFIGGSEEKFDLCSFREKNQDNKRILILGYKPYGQIPFYLKSADVLILPNSSQDKKSFFWTSPLKLFLYLASQVPIVASDLPSIREILNETNAVLVEPDNPGAMALGIKTILAHADLAAKLAAQGYEDVQSHTWQKRARGIIEFLK